MINYRFFLKIAEYGNKNWRGNFTQRELANYANEIRQNLGLCIPEGR